MRNNTLIKCVRYDLRVGLAGNLLKYLLALFVFAFAAVMFFQSARTAGGSGSALDCLIYFYRGMQEYIPSGDSPFPVPVVWLMLQLVVSFLILSYPTQDLESYGMQFLVRTKKRGVWWASKFIWNMVSVFLFYLVGILAAFAFALLLGDGSFAFNQETSLFVSEFGSSAGYAQTLAVVLLLPFLTSAAMAAFQMMLNFVLRPVYSYIIVTAVFLASAYYNTPFLPGNYSMLLRNEIARAGGVNTFFAVLVDAGILCASFFIGLLYFRRYDILQKD